MRIAIIGAGFAGLAAGFYLSKAGHKVTLVEKEDGPGGLAIGFKDPSWEWPLEKHYHHLFTSDWAIRNLAKEIGHKIIFTRPKTSTFINRRIYQLDSLSSLLRFPLLSIAERIRTGVVLGYLRSTPFWRSLEKITAYEFLNKYMGERPWGVLWKSLFEGKFGKYTKEISAVWFWARVKKRSPYLGYPEGGFEALAKSIEKNIKQNGGEFFYKTGVLEIVQEGSGIKIKTYTNKNFLVDKIICTLPTPLFLKIAKDLPEYYTKKASSLKGIGAVNLVIALKEGFLKDGTYWLNINEAEYPFLAVVEHTNFIGSDKYGEDRLLYVGNYLEPNHRYFKSTERDLIEEFTPYLQRINSQFTKRWIRKAWVFKAPFAQPIISLNYSQKILPLKTPIPGLYLANIQQVYPWDRGTNYAIELGEKIAKLATSE